MFAQRIKELRKKNNMTQVQLAEKLGVSKGTVAMWETGKRKPSYDTLNDLCDIFDRRLEFILGYSNDESPFHLTEEQIDKLSRWTIEDDLHELFMQFLALDDYGRVVCDNLIKNEYYRCRKQNTLYETDAYVVTVQILPDDK